MERVCLTLGCPPPLIDAGYRSQPNEYDYDIEDIEGRIPADLAGTYLRNGPSLFEAGDQLFAHPFDGDGQVVSVSIKGGAAHFRSSFVKTEGYLREKEAGKVLYRCGNWVKHAFI